MSELSSVTELLFEAHSPTLNTIARQPWHNPSPMPLKVRCAESLVGLAVSRTTSPVTRRIARLVRETPISSPPLLTCDQWPQSVGLQVQLSASYYTEVLKKPPVAGEELSIMPSNQNQVTKTWLRTRTLSRPPSHTAHPSRNARTTIAAVSKLPSPPIATPRT